MKKLFKVEPYHNLDLALLIIRVAIAGMMLVHGWPKLAMLLEGGPMQFANVLGMGVKASLALTVFAEVLCSFLILIGLGTRIAAIPLIATMAVAVFYIHANDPFIKQELGLHYLLVYALLLLTGSGKYSADYTISRFSSHRAQTAGEG